MVTAYQGGQVDAIVQFDVLTGAPLFNDANFTVVDTPTTPTTAQIWMRCDTGQFADKRVRQALALTIDRPAADHSNCSRARAIPANDHVIWNPSIRTSATPSHQRAQDIAKAKQLLADAGKSRPEGHAPDGKLNEIPPQLPSSCRAMAAPAGIHDHAGRR